MSEEGLIVESPPQPNINVRIRDIRPFEVTGGRRVLVWLIYLLLRLVNLTLRWRLHDPHGVLKSMGDRPMILCVWHNRLALALPAYRRYFLKNHPGRRVAAIASASRDGALVARILRLFGATPVRGSSSRRGLHAMMELVDYAKEGFDLAITPDGPRGPIFSVQPGVVSLAQLTRLPILPASYRLSWKKVLHRSWDRFEIPLPFSRVDVYFGEPIEVPRHYRDQQREEVRALIRKRLFELTQD